MTMTDQPAPPPAPKPKRKYTQRKPRKPRPDATAAPKLTTHLAGLTIADCPSACNAERCVISGRAYCGHPRKGGLQGVDMGNAEAIARLHQAQKTLGKRALDLRYA